MCIPYNGSACSQQLGSRLVFVDPCKVNSVKAMDDYMAKLTTDIGADDYCRVPLAKLLCSVAYPDCDQKRGHHRKQSVCR